QDSNVQLFLHHHSSFFQTYTDTVFSSFAIESQIANLKGVSDVFIYLNDDMYFLMDLHPADFYTSAYGFVFRADTNLNVPPELEARPKRGEWQPLRESNVMLSKRFGTGKRPYVAHVAKVMSIPLLRELVAMFPEAFARTSARLFREVYMDEPGDAHTTFLFPHFVIERWREALLWSWAIARQGADDDSWDADAAWAALGSMPGADLRVSRIRRDTLDTDRVLATLRRTGYSPPGATDYEFASGDGYPWYDVRHGAKGYPDRTRATVCTLARDVCFPPLMNASAAFQHIAFAQPECGDCVINQLVQKSGRIGLAEFLPPWGRGVAPRVRGPTPLTLPVVADWRDTDFSLAGVLQNGTDDVRAWVLRLLDRYRFVLGSTPSEFVFLTGAASASRAAGKLRPDAEIALACINDDVSGDAARVYEIMLEWQKSRWPDKARWEVV
ncbi:hypothetical protein K488DRAFT_56067, partial [Vararia minispora EC-137]